MAGLVVVLIVLGGLLYALVHASHSERRLPDWFHDDRPDSRGFPVVLPDNTQPHDDAAAANAGSRDA